MKLINNIKLTIAKALNELYTSNKYYKKELKLFKGFPVVVYNKYLILDAIKVGIIINNKMVNTFINTNDLSNIPLDKIDEYVNKSQILLKKYNIDELFIGDENGMSHITKLYIDEKYIGGYEC